MNSSSYLGIPLKVAIFNIPHWSSQMSIQKDILVERSVVGHKSYSFVDANGERQHAVEGERVMVTRAAAEAFKERLVHPDVLGAQQEAQVAIQKQKDAEASAEAEERDIRTRVASTEAANKPTGKKGR
jgi:hypothetical protein